MYPAGVRVTRPKMFLWMIEEYVYILSQLHMDDLNGQMVLGHELLLLAHSRCCRKRGGGRGPCRTGIQPVDQLPAISLDRLKHMQFARTDTFSLGEISVGCLRQQCMGQEMHQILLDSKPTAKS